MNEISINLTGRCSLACSYCTRGKVWVGGHDDMEPWLRASLQQSILRGIGTVTFGFVGETTIVPWFPEWVKPLLDAGRQLKTVSNAAQPYTPEVLQALSRFYEVMISIDSADPAVMRKMRGADLDVVLDNTKRLKAAGCRDVHWTAVWIAGSAKEMHGLVALAKQYGIRKINVNLIYKFDEADPVADCPFNLEGQALLDELTAFEEALWFARAQAVELNLPMGNIAEVLRRRAMTGGQDRLVELVHSHQPQGHARYYTIPLAPGETRLCSMPWSGPYVAANGDVYPCCFNGLILDRVTPERPIEAIWQGPAYYKLRVSLQSGRNMDDTCFKCQNQKKRVC